MEDSLEEGEVREDVLPPRPQLSKQLSNQLSSRYTNQGRANTCSIHSCAKVVIRFIKTVFSTLKESLSLNSAILDFIDNSTDEQFTFGNPCNLFYQEEFLKMPMQQSFEAIIIRSIEQDKCSNHMKELIHVILYNYIYKVLLNKFKDFTNNTEPELIYIWFFLCVFPVTIEVLYEIIGIYTIYFNEELPEKVLLKNAMDDVIIILTMIKTRFQGISGPVFLYKTMNIQDNQDDSDLEYVSHLFNKMKSIVTNANYYCTVLVVSKDDRLAHYFTLEDINNNSLVLKDSHGEQEPQSYALLGTSRQNGILTIPFNTLIENMKNFKVFDIVFLSIDDTLNDQFSYKGHNNLLEKRRILTSNINRLLEGRMTNGTNEERTLLCDAITSNYVLSCKALLDSGANPNIGNEEITPLLLSTKSSKTNAITKLLLERGANPTIIGKLNKSPLLNIADQDKNKEGIFENIELFTLMLEKVHPDKRVAFVNTNGISALNLAIYRNNAELCRLLIDNGAIISRVNSSTIHPLRLAIDARQPNSEIINMLIEKEPSAIEFLNSSSQIKVRALLLQKTSSTKGGRKTKIKHRRTRRAKKCRRSKKKVFYPFL